MQFRNFRNKSLGHPRTLLRPSWRRDVKSPPVALGTYCENYVIDIYSYYLTVKKHTHSRKIITKSNKDQSDLLYYLWFLDN